jgi:hypothetical protein
MQQYRPLQTPLILTTPTRTDHQWGSAINAFDRLADSGSVLDPDQADPFFTVLLNNGIETVTEILPRPSINRIGTKSRPFRLLSGREIQLSEDDLRVTGISKRYRIEQIYCVGMRYRIGNPEIATSDHELVFLDDSDPLSYSITIRQYHDDRYPGYPQLP